MKRNQSRHSIQCAFVPVLFGVFAVPVFGQLADSPWPDYGNGLGNTHRSNFLSFGSDPRIKWAYDDPTSANICHAPIVARSGAIVFTTWSLDGHSVVALDKTGSELWIITNRVAKGLWPAATVDGLILHTRYRSRGETGLMARREESGTVVWNSLDWPTSNAMQTGPTVASDGVIYFHDEGQHFRAVDASGNELWFSSGGEFGCNPAVGRTGTIYAGGGVVWALTPSGEVLWTYALPGTGPGQYLSPTVDDEGYVYTGHVNPPHLVKLDPGASSTDERLVWVRNDIGGVPAVGPDGMIYAGYRGELHALAPETGQDVWTYPTGQISESGTENVTIDAAGNLYLANIAGEVMSLTPAGELRWVFDLAPDTSMDIYPSSPVIDTDGTLYIGGCLMRTLYALTGKDTDGDGIIDELDPDDDNDGVDDADDPAPLDPGTCGDIDQDTCDDCTVGVDGFGPLVDQDPLNDGADRDQDGLCDAGDECPLDSPNDSDGDGVCDSEDQCPGVDDTFAPNCLGVTVPTVTAWGLAILTLSLAVLAKIIFRPQSDRMA